MNLPKRLTELREKRGLTQAQLAEQMDVTRQTVSRWELGEVAPSAENLKKLGRIYGVSVDALLGDDPIVPESREDRQVPAPVPAKSRRGVIALLLAVIVILTMALVIGHFSRKGGGTEEEIPVGKLQEEKIVSTPETKFGFTWEDLRKECKNETTVERFDDLRPVGRVPLCERAGGGPARGGCARCLCHREI